jgi:excisionase family DNA binding protein
MPDPELMTVEELAAYLHVDPVTIYRLARRGKISGFRVGGGWRLSKKAIDNWLRASNKNSREQP